MSIRSGLRASSLTEALVVYAALLALLAVNVVLAILPLGGWRVVPIIGIALLQAGIILWFTMEIRGQPALVRLFSLLGFFFVLVLFGLASMDYLTRSSAMAY